MNFDYLNQKNSDSFEKILYVILEKKNLTLHKLSICCRINHSKLYKLVNIPDRDASVDDLICICLALGLTQEESFDLLARKKRTLSPSDKRHQAFAELIDIYSKKDLVYAQPATTLSCILLEADQYLAEQKLQTLPNTDFH